MLITIIFLWSTVTYSQEPFTQYSKRINSIQHVLKPGETISTVLEKNGYKNLYRHGGLVDQTLWKNGIPKKLMNDIPVGTVLYLPYRQTNPIKKVIRKKLRHRKIASQKRVPSVGSNLKEKIKKEFASLELKIGSGFYTVQSKDNNDFHGKIDSKSYTIAKIQSVQYWNSINTYFQMGTHQLSLDNPETSSLSKTSFSIPSFGAGIERSLYNSLYLHLSVDYDPIIFSTENTASIVYVKAGLLQNISFGFKFDIANLGKLNSKLKLSYLNIPSQKIGGSTYKESSGYKASIVNTYRNNKWALSSELFYDLKQLKRDISVDNQTSLGIFLGVNRYWD